MIKIIFRNIFICILILLAIQTNASNPDPKSIIEKCIERHGGIDKFKNINDIYAKLLLKTYTKDGVFENRLYEYFRKPDKLRIELDPVKGGGEAISISWDGTYVYKLVKGKIKKSQKRKEVLQIKESLRFMKLMILTNLLKKSKIKYERFLKKKKVHNISLTDNEGKKIWLWISGKNFALLGARFYIGEEKIPFIIMFIKYHKFGGITLPRYTKIYKNKKLITEAWLSLAKINVLKNRNNFFSNLDIKPDIRKKRTFRPYRD